MWVRSSQIDICSMVRSKVSSYWSSKTKHGSVNDFLFVKCVGNGLAYHEIIEWFLLVVGREDRFTFSTADFYSETRIALKLCSHFRCRKVSECIDIARHQCCNSGCRIRNNFEGCSFECWFFAPVIWVLPQFNPVTFNPAFESKRTCTDRFAFVGTCTC